MGGESSKERSIDKQIRHASGLSATIGQPIASLEAPSTYTGSAGPETDEDEDRETSTQKLGEEEGEDNPLFKGIREADIVKLRALLSKKADPNEVSKTGITPLHLAMLVGDQETILALLGADNLNINAQTKREYRRKSVIINKGSNSLHILAHRGKHAKEKKLEEIVDLIKVLMCFIDAEQKDGEDQTPGDIAKMANTVALITALEKVIRIWKQKTAHRLESIKEAKSTTAEPESHLTEDEKSQILRKKSDLMGMNLFPIMVHLMKKKVFCDSEVGHIAREFGRDREKAAKYIIEEVIAGGSYTNLQHFREALIAVSQENLAELLPFRRTVKDGTE